MLDRPRNRICPSVSRIARSNTRRQDGGLRNGSKPSTTSISAKAPNKASHKPDGPKATTSSTALRPAAVTRCRASP